MTIARIEDVSAGFTAVAADMGAVDGRAGAALEAIDTAQLRKNNLTADRAPLPTDDASQGYADGSRWQHDGQEWVLADAAAGVWEKITTEKDAKKLEISFPTVAAFQSAEIPAEVQQVFIGTGSEIVGYRRQAGASDVQHPDGSGWAKGTVTEADVLAAVTDVVSAGDFIPYLEGTFTPTIASVTAGLSVTGGTVSGRYQRVGNLIFWTVSHSGRTITRGTGAGAVRFGGLPLAAASWAVNSGTIRQVGGISMLGGTGGTSVPANVGLAIAIGADYGTILLSYADGSAPRGLGVSDFSETAGAFTLQMSGWYEVMP